MLTEMAEAATHIGPTCFFDTQQPKPTNAIVTATHEVDINTVEPHQGERQIFRFSVRGLSPSVPHHPHCALPAGTANSPPSLTIHIAIVPTRRTHLLLLLPHT